MIIDYSAGITDAQGGGRGIKLAERFIAAGQEAMVVTAGDAGVDVAHFGEVQCHIIEAPAYDVPLAEKGKSHFAFSRRLYMQAKQLAQQYAPQVVLVSAEYPHDYFGARRIAEKSGARLIHELRSVWSAVLRERYNESADSISVTLANAALRRALQNADAVVSTMPFGENCFSALEVSPKRYLHIPEIADPLCENEPLSEREREYASRIAGNYENLIVYTGEISSDRRLALLMQAAALPKMKDTAVLICGNGGYKIALKRMQKELSIPNVYLMDRVAPGRRLALCELADCVYFGDSRLSAAQFGYTGPDLYNAMRRGKAVLAALEGQDDPVTRSGCGVNSPEATPQALADTACRLLSLSKGRRRDMARLGEQYVAENHSRELVSSRYIELLSAIT